MFGISFIDVRDFLTDPDTMLALLAAVLVFATIVTLTSPMLGQDKMAKRVKSVQNRREELRRKSREAIAADAERRASGKGPRKSARRWVAEAGAVSSLNASDDRQSRNAYLAKVSRWRPASPHLQIRLHQTQHVHVRLVLFRHLRP